MPNSSPGAVWTNGPLFLFHGTTLPSAENIVTRGVDIQQCKDKRDFGKGFYTTTSERQAKDFAIKRALATNQDPAVVLFVVDRSRLSNLSALAFIRGEKDARDYWNFIRNCRQGTPHRTAPSAYYDVVYGPVAVFWDNPRLCFVIKNFDQVSFHTGDAQLMLNDSPRERIL